MFRLTRPSPQEIERFLDALRDQPLSYEPVGLADHPRDGFDLDQEVWTVGSGEATFARMIEAVHDWTHFDLGWVALFPGKPAIAPGTVVAVLVRHFGFWSLNGCRIVYTVGGPDENEFGFAYGTLSDHAESGEEIFKVSLDPATGSVSYLIRAVARPRAVLARLGYPLTRSLQSRFRRDSARRMARAAREIS